MQYNIYISPSANVSYIYGLVLASKQFCGFSRRQVLFFLPLTCGGRAKEWGKEWDAARSEGEPGDKVLKTLQ